MSSKFTEQETEAFYDSEDALYRSFWDKEGSLHWGIFDGSTGRDFLKACANLNAIMAGKANIGRESRVLDMGCGNGTTATWLCRTQGCRVTGVDLSGVRIGNAIESLGDQPEDVRQRLGFEKGSVTALPFEDGSFTHVWSQATFYHVHDKQAALREAYRVLAEGGTLVFDDLIKPKPQVSENARTYVYNRLLFDTDFNFHSYQTALQDAGFQVAEALDLSPHLRTSYQCLSEAAQAHGQEHGEHYLQLSAAYDQMVKAIEDNELGWGFYLCRK